MRITTMPGLTVMKVRPVSDQAAPPGRWERFRRLLEIASQAGELIMSFAEKPTPMGLIGAGLRATNIAYRVHAEVQSITRKDATAYFSSASSDAWLGYSGMIARWLLQHATDRRTVAGYWDGSEHGQRVVIARFGTETIGWIGAGPKHLTESSTVTCFVPREGEAEVLEHLRILLWTGLGSSSARIGRDGLSRDDFDTDGFLPTQQFLDLRARLAAFLALGGARGLMLNGMPGTGKSLGARYLARGLGRTTLRVDLDTLDAPRTPDDTCDIGLGEMLKVFRPEVLIIDDVDRSTSASPMGMLLHLFELALRHCKLVIISVNCPDTMLGALVRPGRIDDIVKVGPLDEAVARKMLGPNADLAPRMSTLPAAYVADMVKRIEALGREQAERELDGLIEHAKMVEEMTRRENRVGVP